MIPVITLHYLVVCSLCFLCAGWMIVQVLSESTTADDDDTSEGLGGIPGGFVFPVFDPPGGRHLDDLLVDRLPADAVEAVPPVAELSTRSVRITNCLARRPEVLVDPAQVTGRWCTSQEPAAAE